MLDWLRKNLGYIGVTAILLGFFFQSLANQSDLRVQIAYSAGIAMLLSYLFLNAGSLKKDLFSRQGQAGSIAGATTLLVVGILALLNFLNFKNSWRVDLTEEQLHALSSQSRNVASSLNQDIQITAFFGTGGPGQASLDSLLEMMKGFQESGPRIEYSIVDPEQQPTLAEKFEIQRLGQAVLESQGKRETVDLLDFNGRWQADNEERLTNALIKVTRETEKAIYFLQGHGERDIEDSREEGFARVAEELRKQNYRVEKLNLGQQDEIPGDADVIISAGPQVKFLESEVEHLRGFLERGGNLLLLVDPMTDFDMNETFLADYGLRLGNNLVLDVSGVGRLLGLGPAAPLVADYADHPVTKEMTGISTFYPRAQSVETVESVLGYSSQDLMTTSARSWGEMNTEAEEVGFDEGVDQSGPLHLAAIASKTIENDENGPEEGTAGTDDASASQQSPPKEPMAGEEGSGSPAEKTKPKESRFVLFGDSDFATNLYFSEGRNGDALLLTVNWLAEDTELIGIRPRQQTDRRVNLTMGQAQLIKWVAGGLLPLVTLVLGFMVWSSRRAA